MAKSNFTFTNSKLLNLTEEIESSFLVNDLEEKSKFLYFRVGPFQEPGSPCGVKRSKIRKSGVRWTLTNEVCSNGKPLWRIEIL